MLEVIQYAVEVDDFLTEKKNGLMLTTELRPLITMTLL